MPVYQDNSSKLWYFRCYKSDNNGIRKQYQKNGFKSKRDALAAERDFLTTDVKEDNKILFSKLWEEYELHAKMKQKKQSYRKTVSKFNNHILPYFKDYEINKIYKFTLRCLI